MNISTEFMIRSQMDYQRPQGCPLSAVCSYSTATRVAATQTRSWFARDVSECFVAAEYLHLVQ